MYNKNKTVIVYLAMNTNRDNVYRRNSVDLLKKSLDNLYIYYNNKFKHDIIIFYDYKFPFSDEEKKEIINNRKEIKFILLDETLWCPPDSEELKINPNISNWEDPKFPIGYRNMMRWYGILIYDYLSNLGYEMYMRMDDDSFILSEIDYDLFEFLYKNDIDYAFRAYCNDYHAGCKGLIEYIYQYIIDNNIKDYWIDRFIKGSSWTTSNYNRLGYYNNFMITKLAFWQKPEVKKFLQYIDKSGYMYTKKWGDLMVQSIAIQIFMDRNKIYQFNDWTYEHSTFHNFDTKSRLTWGGIYPKINNNNSYELNDEYTTKWYKKHRRYHINTFQTLDITKCITVNNNLSIDTNILNISNCLGIYNNISDIYFAINDYCLNCSNERHIIKQFYYRNPFGFFWSNDNNKLYVIDRDEFRKHNKNNNGISFLLNKLPNLSPSKQQIYN